MQSAFREVYKNLQMEADGCITSGRSMPTLVHLIPYSYSSYSVINTCRSMAANERDLNSGKCARSETSTACVHWQAASPFAPRPIDIRSFCRPYRQRDDRERQQRRDCLHMPVRRPVLFCGHRVVRQAGCT